MPNTFRIKAGPAAIRHIKEHGLNPKDISVIPAAAGGPKWIVLYAFDKYLMKYWFSDLDIPLHLVGASAGAWRMMCYAVTQSEQTLDRFLHSYVEQTYPEWPTGTEVSQKLKDILKFTLENDGVNDILTPTNRFLHVITSQTSFRPKEGSSYKLQFGKIVLKNLVSRNLLNGEIDRLIFSNGGLPNELFSIRDKIKTIYTELSPQNISEALRATGTIPMLMDPVTSITEKPNMLWDGALVDYHIGLEYTSPGLVFYPHFSERIIPGWFDKFTPWRKVDEKVTDKMIMLYPSKEFVATLPDQKIPDRKDFETYFDQKEKRISNWYEVAKRGQDIAEEFDELYKTGSLIDCVQPF